MDGSGDVLGEESGEWRCKHEIPELPPLRYEQAAHSRVREKEALLHLQVDRFIASQFHPELCKLFEILKNILNSHPMHVSYGCCPNPIIWELNLK